MVGEYFDPNFAAGVDGQLRDQLEGFAAGQSAGYANGFDEGQAVGWNRAVDISNSRIEKQLASIRQHIQEKEDLRALLTKERQEVVWQGARIRQLEASIADMQLAIKNLAAGVCTGRD